MNESISGSDLLDQLAQEFAERFRRGERPSPAEYAARHPELAEQIHDLFPALAVMEEVGAGDSAGAGTPAPGRALGDFRILRELGRGGMGVVYEAEQLSLGRRVALKVLPFAATLDSQHLRRFQNEAQAAAHLHHNNIVPVFAVGCERGVHYFAMQLIDGRNLAALVGDLRRVGGPGATPCPDSPPTAPYPPSPPVPEASVPETSRPPAAALSTERSPRSATYFRAVADLGVQAALALEHAHQLGVVHRDVKPANLLLDGRGNLWVTDFGLAQVQGDPRLTLTGALVGTLRYMSPEQALARRGVVDHRTDIYSLGATLYELLTLEPAFAGGDRQELLRRITQEEPRLPRRVNRAVPPELETIVLKAMAKSPEERYGTARELADDLRRFLEDRPIKARRPTLLQRARKWARRHRVLTGAAGLVTFIALAAGLVVLGREEHWAKEALREQVRAGQKLQAALHGQQQAAYFYQIALAERELAANNVGRAEDLLDDCPPHLRGWEWHYLKRRPYGPLTFRGHRAGPFGLAFSPDGKYVASTSASIAYPLGEVKVWDRRTGRVVHTLLGHAAIVVGVAFSPDGKKLATASWDDRTVKVWDLAAEKELQTLRGHADYVCGVAFSRDGKLLLSAGWEGTVIVWDAATFQKLRTLHGPSRGIHSLAPGPGGRVAAAGHDGTVRLWDARTGRELHTLRGHLGPVLSVAFSRDGKLLASTGMDGTAKLWDPAAGRHLATIRADTVLLNSVAFSPDGKRLATGGFERTVRVWDLETRQEALALRGHADMVYYVLFSPDGQQLASTSRDGTVKVWDAGPPTAGPELLTLRGHTGAVLGVAFHPGGKRLASTGLDGTVRLWDATTGEELAMLPGQPGAGTGVAFSRDGRTLAAASLAGVVTLWDVETRKVKRTFRGFAAGVALSPDGRQVASASEAGDLSIWDARTGKEKVPPFRGHRSSVTGLAFSPDGKRLATTGMDGTAKVWDAATGRLLFPLTGHRNIVQGVAFSADGRRLATASWDKTAKVWDAATGKELLTLRGHTDRVLGVAFRPDGKCLATASWDNTAKVWEAATGNEIATLRGHSGYVLGVAFSPDGKRLATAGGYRGRGEVKVWDATGWDAKPNR